MEEHEASDEKEVIGQVGLAENPWLGCVGLLAQVGKYVWKHGNGMGEGGGGTTERGSWKRAEVERDEEWIEKGEGQISS